MHGSRAKHGDRLLLAPASTLLVKDFETFVLLVWIVPKRTPKVHSVALVSFYQQKASPSFGDGAEGAFHVDGGDARVVRQLPAGEDGRSAQDGGGHVQRGKGEWGDHEGLQQRPSPIADEVLGINIKHLIH